MMKIAAMTALLGALGALSAPVYERQMMNSTGPSDTDILQYALTLEHLEYTFYSQALDKFSDDDFKKAGYPDWVRGRVNQICQHEKSHVALLTAALGSAANAACEYAFPYTDVASFLALADGIENIGTSAYIGAAGYITEPAYLTIAATITTVEARHNGFFNGPVELQNDWTGPYDTPLSLDMVYTLAAQLITSCPSSNAALPVKSYGPLLIGGSPIAAADAGSSVAVTFDNAMNATGTMYAAVYNGLGSVAVPMDGMSFTLPQDIQGFSYVVITTSANVTEVADGNIVAGPAEILTNFNAGASNPGFMNPFGA